MEDKTKKSSPKSRLVVLLLCIFVGVLGIHRMYVGKVGSGVVMLLLSITGIGLFVTAIWCLLDLISIASGGFQDKQNLWVLNWDAK